MVITQSAAAATTAVITASITTLRSIKGNVPARRAAANRKGPPGRPSIAMRAKRLRRPFAVGSMAPDAILAHLGQLNLEALEILGCLDRRLRVAGELGEPRREIGLVLQTAGNAAVSPTFES